MFSILCILFYVIHGENHIICINEDFKVLLCKCKFKEKYLQINFKLLVKNYCLFIILQGKKASWKNKIWRN